MSGSAEAAIEREPGGARRRDGRTRRRPGARRRPGRSSRYRELDDGAARFAGLLAARGVRAGDRVGAAAAEHPGLRRGLLRRAPARRDRRPAEHAARGARDRRAASSTRARRSSSREPGRACGAVAAGRSGRGSIRRPARSRWRRSTAARRRCCSTPRARRATRRRAELSHAGLTWIATQLGAVLGVGPDDVVFGAAPLAHVFGQSAALNMTIAAGASVALDAPLRRRRGARADRARARLGLPGRPDDVHRAAPRERGDRQGAGDARGAHRRRAAGRRDAARVRRALRLRRARGLRAERDRRNRHEPPRRPAGEARVGRRADRRNGGAHRRPRRARSARCSSAARP